MASSFLTSSSTTHNHNNNPSVSTTTNPVIDRYLSNPLTFKQGKTMDTNSSSHDLAAKSSSYIILSRKQTKNRNLGAIPASGTASKAISSTSTLTSTSSLSSSPSRVKPKSMAEAVAAYTGKKFLTKNERRKQQKQQSKKRKLDLVDSEQDDDEDGDSSSPVKEIEESSSPILTASSYIKNIFNSFSGNNTRDKANKRQKIQLAPIETDDDDDDDEDEDEDEEDEEDLGEFVGGEDDDESNASNVTDEASPFNGFSEPESKGATPVPQHEEEDDDDEDEEDEDDADFQIDQEEDTNILNQSSSGSSSSPDPEDEDEDDEDEDEDVEKLKHDLKEDAYKALEEENEQVKHEDEEEDEEEDDEEEGNDSDKPTNRDVEKSTPPTSPEDEQETVAPTATTATGNTTTLKTINKPHDLQTIKQKFYMINENPNDKGSNNSKRIYKNWRELSKKKPVGLINHGVTCYMNSAIQAMIHIPAIQHYLTDVNGGKYNKTLKPRSVTHVLADLSKKMWNIDGNQKSHGGSKMAKFINPKKLIGRLDDINCMMSQWQQEDSHEYFMSLMSRLQEDSTPKGKKLNESIIYDIFGGLLKQKITCMSCKNISITKQEFYDLSLGLNKRKQSSQLPSSSITDSNNTENSQNQDQPISPSNKYSIGKSIRDFFSNELIKIDRNDIKNSGYYCEKCKKRTMAHKISFIERSPETLTIHLKRFKFNGNSSSKVKQSINYSKFLDLSKYCLNENDKDDDNNDSNEGKQSPPAMYQLLSVLVHEGRSLSSGHYIAHCLQPDGSWASYDDEYINKIDERMAMNDPSAYVLVYTKLTPK